MTPTLFHVDSGMEVTSLTTWAGAGVTAVKVAFWLELLVALTMKRAPMITMTRATAPQAM